MTNATQTSIYVTNRDLGRLEELLSMVTPTRGAEALEGELARAVIMTSEEIPPTVVTMNSRVCFRDEDTGEESEVQLVYPRDADVAQNKISILAPVGIALLGQVAGDTIRRRMPSGNERALTVLAIPFQPEAAGMFEL